MKDFFPTKWVRQLSSDLRVLEVTISHQELALTVLCGSSTTFEHIIVASDAVLDDIKLTMDFVKFCLLQEE